MHQPLLVVVEDVWELQLALAALEAGTSIARRWTSTLGLGDLNLNINLNPAGRHVNRKALDQWTSFTEERVHLRKRQEETARAEAKIRQLIQTLDLRKDEAIERTFKARHNPLRVCSCCKSAYSTVLEQQGGFSLQKQQCWLQHSADGCCLKVDVQGVRKLLVSMCSCAAH